MTAVFQASRSGQVPAAPRVRAPAVPPAVDIVNRPEALLRRYFVHAAEHQVQRLLHPLGEKPAFTRGQDQHRQHSGHQNQVLGDVLAPPLAGPAFAIFSEWKHRNLRKLLVPRGHGLRPDYPHMDYRMTNVK